jgi:hypothetical protein
MNSIEQRMEDAREWARKIANSCKDYGGYIIEHDVVEYLAEFRMIADWYLSDMRLSHKESTELNELREFYHAAKAREVEESNLVEHQDGGESGQAAEASCGDRTVNCPEGKEEIKGIIYVAGPMTGLPEHNFPAFHAAAAMLRAQGFLVYNPAEMGEITDPLLTLIKHDVCAILECTHMFMLPDWENSKGAKAERGLADWMSLIILTQADFPS